MTIRVVPKRVCNAPTCYRSEVIRASDASSCYKKPSAVTEGGSQFIRFKKD